jgi:hypothetical protein
MHTSEHSATALKRTAKQANGAAVCYCMMPRRLEERQKPRLPHIWWRHSFYQSRWNCWRESWEKLLKQDRGSSEHGPRDLLRDLGELHVDPEIAIRLAFLVAAHKPSTQSELAKDTRRQQRIKRKLKQAGQRLLDAARLLEEAAREFRPVFIRREHIHGLDRVTRVCADELEILLEPHVPELPSGHELFTLVLYFEKSAGRPHYPLVTDLLEFAYGAAGRRGPGTESVSQAKRFARTKKHPDSILPQVIEDQVTNGIRSGELKEELLACFPGLVVS